MSFFFIIAPCQVMAVVLILFLAGARTEAGCLSPPSGRRGLGGSGVRRRTRVAPKRSAEQWPQSEEKPPIPK